MNTPVVTRNQPAPTVVAPKRMTLGAITKSRRVRPPTVLLYGPEGVGKSSWAADAPNPIFLCSEDGIDHLDVQRFPAPQNWHDVIDATELLLHEKHNYKTFVFDTVDWLEPIAWGEVCRIAKKESIEDLPYGKGYTAALDLWRSLLSKLEQLRDNGMGIVLLGHAQVKAFANPEGENFDRYELKLQKGLAGLLKEWVYAVLFASYEIFAAKLNKDAKAKGVGSGARIVHTERRPAFDAKNRYGLPLEMPLAWGDFWAYATADNGAVDCDRLETQIRNLASNTPLAQDVEKLITKADGNAERLAKLIDWVSAKLNQENDNA